MGVSKLASNAQVSPNILNLVGEYAGAVSGNFALMVEAQPEDQLKAPVGGLLKSLGGAAGLDVNWRTEVFIDDVDGRPDIGVTVGGLLTGHIELKRPGLGARPERFTGRNRTQWRKFPGAAQPDLHRRLRMESVS